MKHTIRHKNGGDVVVKNYVRSKAIKLMCTGCLGWGEEEPQKYTSFKCPLFPFRGKKLDAISTGMKTATLKEVCNVD